MSSERLDYLVAWQEAAYVERDHLHAARDAISEMLGDEVGEYPRARSLDSQISEIERQIARREQRIVALQESESVRGEKAPRLTMLLRRQEEAQEDRAALIAARDAIVRDADDAGQVDLDDEQDRRFRQLTREVADIDEEVRNRAEEIEVLAALAAVNPTT